MEHHIIVSARCKSIRAIARDCLKGNWLKAVLAYLIYYLFTNFIANILGVPFGYNYDISTNPYLAPFINRSMMGNTMVNVPYGGYIYLTFVEPAFQLGMIIVFLMFFRKHTVNHSLMFEGFSHWGKVFWMSILIGIKVLLWSLLLVIPGFIAGYRYSQAYFVLADNPTWSASECLRESSRLMVGNKWKLFTLQLSFIGWMLLAELPYNLIGRNSTGNQYLDCFADFVLMIPAFFVFAYMLTAETSFYEMITGHLHIISHDQADELQEKDEVEL